MYAEIHATLRNTQISKAWKVPSGDVWTGDMFMPDYKIPKPEAGNDIGLQAAFKRMAERKPMTRTEIVLNSDGRAEVQRRTEAARKMQAEGADTADVRRMMLEGK